MSDIDRSNAAAIQPFERRELDAEESTGQIAIPTARSAPAILPMKQVPMDTEMADSPQKKPAKSQVDDDDLDQYEYKTVKYKDFVTKPKYIRGCTAHPLVHPFTDERSVVDSGDCGRGTHDTVCGQSR